MSDSTDLNHPVPSTALFRGCGIRLRILRPPASILFNYLLFYFLHGPQIDDDSMCKGHEFGSETNQFCLENIDVSNFLNLHSLGNHEDFCLAYVFTYRDFTGGTLGESLLYLCWVSVKDQFCLENIDVSNFLNLHSLGNPEDFCLAFLFTYWTSQPPLEARSVSHFFIWDG